jgi:YVTN family beta-propeller protein
MPDQDSVSRIDPNTNSVQQTIAVGNDPEGIAVGGGFVWVANAVAGTVSQIDPEKNGGQVVDTIAVGNRPSGVAYGLGGVWVANSSDRTVMRIDPLTGAVGRSRSSRWMRSPWRRCAVGDERVVSVLSRLTRGPGA